MVLELDRRIGMVEPFMMAARDRRVKMNDRITFTVLVFVIGILVGMLFQSVLSKVLDTKAAAAVAQMQATSE